MSASVEGSFGRESESRSKDSTNKSTSDDLTDEFQYYGKTIKKLTPTLTDSSNRELAEEWIKKLFGVEYCVKVLRDKRNRYLASLAINIINDQMAGVFEESPPEASLEEISNLPIINSPQAEWEKDTTWSEFFSAFPGTNQEIPCTFHENAGGCHEDSEIDKQLETEFWFLLHEMRPQISLIPCPLSKSRAIQWMHLLCLLSTTKCIEMKGLRNDYAYCLYAYVCELKVAGPFKNHPPRHRLPTLEDSIKKSTGENSMRYEKEADSFMESQPIPDEGAICYVAVTGDILDPNKLLPA